MLSASDTVDGVARYHLQKVIDVVDGDSHLATAGQSSLAATVEGERTTSACDHEVPAQLVLGHHPATPPRTPGAVQHRWLHY